jgi:hypothetical protein
LFSSLAFIFRHLVCRQSKGKGGERGNDAGNIWFGDFYIEKEYNNLTRFLMYFKKKYFGNKNKLEEINCICPNFVTTQGFCL